MIRKLVKSARTITLELRIKKNIAKYKSGGMIPWSMGYQEYKEEEIKKKVYKIKTPWYPETNYGIGLDERIVEYPWILSKLSKQGTTLLDAGSSLNHYFILGNEILQKKHITICTYQPESQYFNQHRINYIYEDLRRLPIREGWFDEVVCISTLEHIDMDNSIYGYDLPNHSYEPKKSTEYLKVVGELVRVLKKGGLLLITVPFGKFETHGFFQQFDNEMINSIIDFLSNAGIVNSTYFQYTKSGWILSSRELCSESESYNPHSGRGLKNDGAAHSRAICCLEFKSTI